MDASLSPGLTAAIIAFAWIGLGAAALLVLALTYFLLRMFTEWVVSKGLFPTALAPALIIAARLRVTKKQNLSGFVAMVVLKEIARAERLSPEFKASIEAEFAERHTLAERW